MEIITLKATFATIKRSNLIVKGPDRMVPLPLNSRHSAALLALLSWVNKNSISANGDSVSGVAMAITIAIGLTRLSRYDWDRLSQL